MLHAFVLNSIISIDISYIEFCCFLSYPFIGLNVTRKHVQFQGNKHCIDIEKRFPSNVNSQFIIRGNIVKFYTFFFCHGQLSNCEKNILSVLTFTFLLLNSVFNKFSEVHTIRMHFIKTHFCEIFLLLYLTIRKMISFWHRL